MRFLLLLVALVAGSSVEPVRADPPGGDWPQWLGPNRNNHSFEVGLLTSWPPEGPPLQWKAEGLGHGVASVAVCKGWVFTLGYHDGNEFVTALNEETGKIKWRSPIGPEVQEAGIMRYLAQRTPTVDGERVYAITAAGALICLQFSDGKELWRKDFIKDFGGKRGVWGFCDYPFIESDRLICTPAGAEATILALSKTTGDVIWKCPIPDAGANAYSALIPLQIDGVRQYVNFLQKGRFGIAAADGKLLWQFVDGVAQAGNTHNLIPLQDGVFSANGFLAASVRLRLSQQGKDFKANVAYHVPSRFQSWFGTAVRLDDRVVTLSSRGNPQCHDLQTGKMLWESTIDRSPDERVPRNRSIAMTYAEGHLIIRDSEGLVGLLKVEDSGCRKISSFHGPVTNGEPAWSMPVVTGGRLYLRDQDRLFCYNVRAPRTKSKVPDAVFVSTPQDVVEKMLELAKVTKSDIVYDLGCGDGRIVVTAALKHGARGVGVDIDPDCIHQSVENVKRHQVEHLVRIEQGDLFQKSLDQADVITLYLLSNMNEKLLPRLEKLKPGCRIVCHYFPIPGIKPDQVVQLDSKEDGEKHPVYLMTTPLKKVPGK
jgi:outer membrane protein assembly factor BamB/precorrin-6B methylase 2